MSVKGESGGPEHNRQPKTATNYVDVAFLRFVNTL